MKITSKQYIEFVNNFVTIERFASYYDLTVNVAISIINRSRVMYNSETIKEITRLNKWANIPSVSDYSTYSVNNALVFKARDDKRLLAEHSA